MRTYKLTLVFVFLSLLAMQSISQEHNVQPSNGLVPDAKTAITIAVAIWTPIYGEKQIASQKPYVAILKQGNWTVTGSLPHGTVGGTAIAVISKTDGRVVRVSHGK
jgi:NTF2 fold immunity protein